MLVSRRSRSVHTRKKTHVKPMHRRIVRVSRGLDGKPHFFRRSAQFSISWSGTSNFFAAYDFNPFSGTVTMPSPTDFTNVYRQYKVHSVMVQFVPNANVYNNSVETATSPVENQPIMYLAFDPVDITAWTSLTGAQQALSYSKLQKMPLSRSWKKRFYPTVLRNIYYGSGNGANEKINTRKIWLTMGSQAVMYGLKIGVSYSGTGTNSNIGQFVFTWSFSTKTII